MAISTPTADHFRELETWRTRALVARDMHAIERLHAPGYQLVTPAGKVFDRARYLAALADGPFYAGWETGEIDVRLSPRMALLRYRATLTFPSGRQVVCWHIDSYEPSGEGGAWQAVWSQATELTAPSP
ncbi:MAG: nuclear transport factor 2 family protein [Pseudomonadota bacterium]